MRTLLKLLGGTTLLVLGANIAVARDYYVAPSGSDRISGDSAGTFSNPYLTPGKVATLVNPGDTVYLMNGTYPPFSLRRSGASDSQRITWKAYAGHFPEIVVTPDRWSAISVTASYQTIDGLTLTGNNGNVTLAQAEADYYKSIPKFFAYNPVTKKADINPATGRAVTVDTPNPTYQANYGGNPAFNNSGISIDNRKASNPAHHLTVQNTTVRRFGCGGIGVINADYTVIKDNKIYNNSWYSRYGCSGATIFTVNENPSDTFTGYRNTVSGNIFWNNRGLVKWIGTGKYKVGEQEFQADGKFSDGNGFILDISEKDSTNQDYKGRTLITNNLAVYNGGSGIHSFKGRRADIVNNTAYLNGDKVDYPDIYAGYSTDIKLYNNVVYARPDGKVNSNSNNVNVSYDYNIYFNGKIAAGTQGAHDIIADPAFEKPDIVPCTENANTPTVTCQADFRLRGTSPGINSGVAISRVTPTNDLKGVLRPMGNAIDRGAFEYNIFPQFKSSRALEATRGVAFSTRMVIYNYPTSVVVTGLPAGVTANQSIISGTPTARGTYQLNVRSTNLVGTTTTPITLTVR